MGCLRMMHCATVSGNLYRYSVHIADHAIGSVSYTVNDKQCVGNIFDIIDIIYYMPCSIESKLKCINSQLTITSKFQTSKTLNLTMVHSEICWPSRLVEVST